MERRRSSMVSGRVGGEGEVVECHPPIPVHEHLNRMWPTGSILPWELHTHTHYT